MLNKEILKIIGETLPIKNNVSLESFERAFRDLIKDKERFKNAYLTLYIYEKFCKTRDIQTRKTSARDFEDFLSAISGGTVADTSTRHNLNEEGIFVENPFITEWVVNNRREKADILYPNGYKVTVKTLVEDNHEINMGAFEKKALFSELNVTPFLEERVSSNNGVGLGSKPQLLALLNKIKKDGNWIKFSKRFIEMSRRIFSEDIILFIKSSNNPKVYLITSEYFNNQLKECANDPKSFIKLVNRWEGNNIRVDRKRVVEDLKPITLSFEYLNKHIISEINTNLKTITKCFVLYIEDNKNKEDHKSMIVNLCEDTLSHIDKKIEKLI